MDGASPTPAPSEREPSAVAGAFTIQPGTCETVGVRAIFIAPTKLKVFNRSHSSGDTPSVTPFGRDSSLREGAGNAIVRPDAIHRTARNPGY